MKFMFLIMFNFIVCLGFSQKKSKKQIKLEQRIANDKELYGYTSSRAIKDTAMGDIGVLFPGGKIPTIFSSSDSLFERKYHVSFIGQDCIHYQSYEEEIVYNRVMFEYLDKHYGLLWREEIRQDAIGLNE